ncbi:hypothetical protein Ae201684P_000663 [Aphanomyces euteiches]|uniref:Uncharacterized protein n=1 Tax=Aphanomyces euteiches TaxID=100861 RepID=A0A6G0XQU1_9STRA|nr:hypothetical protein Ae201684_002220 [Aphanomyces euteiches]KAH9087252.1 hypothetical protein Ae201684P_000663 [Aphanomyces euteiches]KAH9142665.1 hypothetical protein AeRB84_013312 [Aphanomyces euteiches]
MAPPASVGATRWTGTASLDVAAKHFSNLRDKVLDVPISIDFNTWRMNLSLLTLQTMIVNGTHFSEYRWSLFTFTSLWLGRSFFHAEYAKKFRQLYNILRKRSMLGTFSVSGLLMLVSFGLLVRATRNYAHVVVYIAVPCAIFLLAEWFRGRPRLATPVSFVFALEHAHFASVVTLIFEVNPLLIYDQGAARAVVWTACFNNLMAGMAKYFILHYTQHQIAAHDLHGWKPVSASQDKVEPWTSGQVYKSGAVVRHLDRTWEAIGERNQATPGSWSNHLFVWLWRRPFRLLTCLMMLQVVQVIGLAIYSFCCDSLLVVGGMMFVSADYLQLMHSIRYAMLGKSFRQAMLSSSDENVKT